MAENYFYSTNSPGIGGRIKRRIADFQVKEIGLDGSVCEIKSFSDTEKKETEKNWVEQPQGKDQLILELEKFNTDLNQAVRKISRFIKTSKKRIGYAGMKDKRAITSQRISIWQPDLENLKKLNSRYLDLRPVEWSNERIDIGMLKGNEFIVSIREIELSKEETEKRIKECFEETKKGIANYFGEQRFGGIRQITHLVGKEFVKGNLGEGVMLYLTATCPEEEEEVKKARINLAKSIDFSQAIKEFPSKYRYERSIIHHLCKYPKDFAGAFSKLPKALTYMFTHAYQSHLFNKIVEERLRQGIGLKPVKGDIAENGKTLGPLFGFESKLAEGIPGEIEQKVLEKEGISLEQFKIKQLSQLSSKGARKEILLEPENTKLIKVEEDELNEGKLKATISFYLSKGNYATTVLKELMKN